MTREPSDFLRRSPHRKHSAACLLLAALLALAAVHVGCSKADGAADFAHIPAADFFAGLADRDGILLDIRTPQEFAAGHIPGAVLLDFHHPAFRFELANLDRSAPYFIYCRTGNRTRQAMRLFRELGFASVVGLDKGIEGLRKPGLSG